jgi:hypothetical protein
MDLIKLPREGFLSCESTSTLFTTGQFSPDGILFLVKFQSSVHDLHSNDTSSGTRVFRLYHHYPCSAQDHPIFAFFIETISKHT